MDNQESSEESSVCEAETDSEEMSTSDSDDENKQESTSFILPVLNNDQPGSTNKRFRRYLEQKSRVDSFQQMVNMTSEPVAADFTPWWESIQTVKKSKQGQSTSKDSLSADGSFNSWFDKSMAIEETDNWLAGDKPKSSSTDDPSPVEDIEVPSVYLTAPTVPKGRRAMKKERKLQQNKTTGKKWFDMKMPDMDSKSKMDLEIIKMRKVLNPKHFFKSNDRAGLPKYFQLGTVVDEGTDFYSSRLTKKERKQTLVEELMSDAQIRQHNKKKYETIQQKKMSRKLTRKKKV